MLDWSRYLESIRSTYAQWWRVYTFTDVVGEVPQPEKATVPLLDFGLMVETRVPEEKEGPAPDEDERYGEGKKKVERLGVLAGLRKYALGAEQQHVLLVGRPGSGKSTALLRMLLEEAESDRIPILVELRYYQTSTLELIRRFLVRHGITLSHQEIEQYLVQDHFLLLIDGINELPSEEARRNVKAFRQDYPRTPMVFTTRELGLGGDLEIGRRLEMQALSEEQMRQFVLKYLPGRGEEMWGQMGDRLRQLGETPLLLWMLCSVFAGRGDIPNSLGLVFRRFTALYGEKLKEDVAAESRRWWTVMLRQLAWMMTEGDSPTEILVAIPRTRAEAALVACLREKVAFPEARAKEWLEELLRHHLIQLRADEQIEFRHQLIQEYYAAEGLLQQVRDITDEVLQRRYLNYLKWTEPVALMLELVADEALAMRVVERALEVDLRLGARLTGAMRSHFRDQIINAINDLTLSAHMKCLLLADTKANAAVTGLLEALKHEDYYIRSHAADALGEIKSDASVPGLLEALEHEDYCSSAADALGKIKSDVALVGLLEALKHEDYYIRSHAADALGEIKSDAAMAGLLETLKDQDLDVRNSAADALGEIKSDAAVAGLLKALKDESAYTRSRAADALGEIESDAAVTGLLELLNDENYYVRNSAADALGKIKSDAAVAGLLEALKAQDLDVRNSAADVLGEVESDASVPVPLQLIKDQGSDVHSSPTDALEKNRSDAAAVAGLLNALRDRDSNVRSSAADALKKIKSDAVVPGLLQVLTDKDSGVRRRATDVLIVIKSDAAVGGLLHALKDKDSGVRRRAADALGQIRSDRSVSGLLNALKDQDSAVRSSAIDALRETKSDAVFPSILYALKDQHHGIRCRAAYALGETKSDVAVPQLIWALKDWNSDVRCRAADALGKIKSDAAVPQLIQSLKDWGFGARHHAASALEAIASPKSLPQFHKLLPETDNLDLLDTIAKIQEKCRFYQYYPDDEHQNSDRPMTNQPDVFIAHNSGDKKEIRQLRDYLQKQGIQTWLDEDNIIAGDRFQVAIQQAIAQVKAAAICIGQNGLGRWQDEELDALISQCVKRGIRVIPVLLPGVDSIPSNFLFLESRHAVSFNRIDDETALSKLIQGITQPVTANP